MPASMFDSPWPEGDNTLRKLWAVQPDGTRLSLREVAERMGISRGAVSGRLGVLNLPTRSGKPRKLENVTGGSRRMPVVPETRGVSSMVAASPYVPAVRVRVANGKPPVHEPGPKAPPPRIIRAPTECCWPIGDPRSPGFRSCDAAVDTGRPYCPEHSRLAFGPRADRRAESTGRTLGPKDAVGMFHQEDYQGA